MSHALAGLMLAGVTTWASPVNADETHRGRLEAGDATLERGEFYDQYVIATQPGDTLRVDLTSRNFDTYLALVSPANVLYRIDDYRGSKEQTRFEMIDLIGGEWTVVATSTQVVDGDYILQSTTMPAPLGEPMFQEVGSLGRGDVIDELHYVDEYAFNVEHGQRYIIDLTARRFDTYLKITLPDGRVIDSDDYLGAINHSRIDMTAARPGRVAIEVRGFDRESEGRYELQVVPVLE